ncbi:MAG: TrkH family potassium uptake protein [Anaerolineae bacterium]
MRHTEFLRQRYRAILAYSGLICLIAGLLILSPLALLLAYRQEASAAWGFLLPGLLLSVSGSLLWRGLRPRAAVSLSTLEGNVIVLVCWIAAIVVSAIPFLVISKLNLLQALFESTSGWTTAGLSVVDVEHASPLILFYRSVLQLAGGAGLAILMLSALGGPVGPGLSIAEGRSEQLLPHVRQSAKLVLSLYAGYVVVGTLALAVAGMSWFDAVNHAFTALSTGGFSTRTESIAYWQSPAIEAVLMVLMLLGTTNFLTAYTLLKGRFRAVVQNSEIRLTALLIILGSGVVFLGGTAAWSGALGQRLRVAIFNTVSALSTTGFATADYRPWTGLGWLVLVLLMLTGGATGSTAGGIKQYRIYVLYRGLVWEFRRRLLPRHAVTEPDVWKGEQRSFIDDSHLREVALFVLLYLSILVAGVAVLTAHGYPLPDSIFEYTSALSTVGVSIGITAANAPPGVLWAEIAAMILGRLEFFAIVIGLACLLRDMPPLVRSWVAGNRASEKRPQDSAGASRTIPGATTADQAVPSRAEAAGTEPLKDEQGETRP